MTVARFKLLGGVDMATLSSIQALNGGSPGDPAVVILTGRIRDLVLESGQDPLAKCRNTFAIENLGHLCSNIYAV